MKFANNFLNTVMHQSVAVLSKRGNQLTYISRDNGQYHVSHITLPFLKESLKPNTKVTTQLKSKLCYLAKHVTIRNHEALLLHNMFNFSTLRNTRDTKFANLPAMKRKYRVLTTMTVLKLNNFTGDFNVKRFNSKYKSNLNINPTIKLRSLKPKSVPVTIHYLTALLNLVINTTGYVQIKSNDVKHKYGKPDYNCNNMLILRVIANHLENILILLNDSRGYNVYIQNATNIISRCLKSLHVVTIPMTCELSDLYANLHDVNVILHIPYGELIQSRHY